MSLPYYFRYPSNAIAGMQGLTLEERGAYNTIIDLIYDRDGAIRDDATFLRYLACDVRVWRRVRTALVAAGKIAVSEDGWITNGKATDEIAARERRQEIARTSGVSSGEVRRKLSKKTKKNNGKRELLDNRGKRLSPTENNLLPGDAARPLEMRAAMPGAVRAKLGQLGESFCGSYLDPATWVDVPRSLTPRTGAAHKAIRASSNAMELLAELDIALNPPPPVKRAG